MHTSEMQRLLQMGEHIPYVDLPVRSASNNGMVTMQKAYRHWVSRSDILLERMQGFDLTRSLHLEKFEPCQHVRDCEQAAVQRQTCISTTKIMRIYVTARQMRT